MSESYERRLSPVERLWLVTDRMCPPFANQMVLEGEGTLDEDAWRAAVARAAAAAPGSRLVLRGHLGRSRWVVGDGGPAVRRVDGAGWDGRGSEGAPFLQCRLPVREGPTVDVVLVDGGDAAPPRVVFRTHHAVMDGRGTMTFADDVFRALRGENPQGTPGPLARVDDHAFSRALDAGEKPRRAEDCRAPTGLPDGAERGVRWRRVTLSGRHRQLLPRAACALAALAREHGEGPVRFDVPVDMRARRPDVRSTANLTGMIHVGVAPDDTPDDVAWEVRRQLDERMEALVEPVMGALRGVPLGLMVRIGEAGLRKVHGAGRYICTAVLSNLGRIDLGRYAGGGFHARTAFFVPPGHDSTPLFLTLAGHPGGVELAATVPRVLATADRLETTLAALGERLA